MPQYLNLSTIYYMIRCMFEYVTSWFSKMKLLVQVEWYNRIIHSKETFLHLLVTKG